MAGNRQRFDLQRLGFADDVDWLPSPERARINAPTISLRVMATTAWILATAVSLIAVGFIPPSRRRRGQQSALRRRMLRSALKRWLGPDARRIRYVAELDELADGTLVRMEGTVRFRPSEDGATCPFERVAITLEIGNKDHPRLYHLVCDRAVNFDLVDSRGRAARVLAADARLIGPSIDEEEHPVETLRGLEPLEWPPPLDERRPILHRLTMGRFRLADGDKVEIYGTKDRAVDRMLGERLARQDPICAALRSSKRAPLVIVTR